MTHELRKENGALYRVIKDMNFGQFLFLYYFARNTPCTVCTQVLEKLKQRCCGRRNENQSRKPNSSTLPSYKSSWDNLDANAPTDSINEEHKFANGHGHAIPQDDRRKNRQGSIVVRGVKIRFNLKYLLQLTLYRIINTYNI